jgi:hypothetical protein
VHRERAAPHSCWPRAADRRTDSSRSQPQDWPWRSLRVASRCRPRAHLRARFREHTNADLELRRHLIEHRLHDRRHARHHDYIADPEARRSRHLVEDEIRALWDARQAQARLVHLGAGRLHPFVQDGERARIGIDRHAERLRQAVGGDVTVGRPDPTAGEDVGVAMPERRTTFAPILAGQCGDKFSRSA